MHSIGIKCIFALITGLLEIIYLAKRVQLKVKRCYFMSKLKYIVVKTVNKTVQCRSIIHLKLFSILSQSANCFPNIFLSRWQRKVAFDG